MLQLNRQTEEKVDPKQVLREMSNLDMRDYDEHKVDFNRFSSSLFNHKNFFNYPRKEIQKMEAKFSARRALDNIERVRDLAKASPRFDERCGEEEEVKPVDHKKVY